MFKPHIELFSGRADEPGPANTQSLVLQKGKSASCLDCINNGDDEIFAIIECVHKHPVTGLDIKGVTGDDFRGGVQSWVVQHAPS